MSREPTARDLCLNGELMPRPFSLFVGLRYLRAKRRNHFVSFISVVSVLGIVIGVMALIAVLSVMNGFDQELRSRILAFTSHITISGFDGQLEDWQHVSDVAQKTLTLSRTRRMSRGRVCW